jgi:hypothetical protein
VLAASTVNCLVQQDSDGQRLRPKVLGRSPEARSPEAMQSWLTGTLAGFRAVTANELARSALQQRTDVKFVLSPRLLPLLLKGLTKDYGVIENDGQIAAQYRSLYFDTSDRQCYHDHRRGKSIRHKIRIRQYVDRGEAYLEIKRRQGGGATHKVRGEHPFATTALGAGDAALVRAHTPFEPKQLEPQLWTNYQRVCLVSLHDVERVTIDLQLQFESSSGACATVDSLLLEVKQARINMRTPIMQALRERGIRPTSLSKYCAGTILTGTPVPANRLRESLRCLQAVRSAPRAFTKLSQTAE